MRVFSSAFGEGAPIPERYTCEGADRSPPLAWDDVPDGTRSLALIVEDPDAPAGTWVHWVVYDLPPSVHGLVEGQPIGGAAREGLSDFGRVGYGGPCPPGGTHRYTFKLLALDAPLGLAAGASCDEVLGAAAGHVLAEAQLMGRFSR